MVHGVAQWLIGRVAAHGVWLLAAVGWYHRARSRVLHALMSLIFCSRRTRRSRLRKSNACSQIRLEVHAARASVHPAQPDRRSYTRDISLSVPSQFPSQNSNASATTARRVPPPQSSCSSSAGPGAAQTLGAGRQHREACTGRDISASLLLGRVHTHQHHHSPHRHAILTLTMSCGTC